MKISYQELSYCDVDVQIH